MTSPESAAPLAVSRRDSPADSLDARSAQLITFCAGSAVATLILTGVHHVYGAYRYATPWRLHVLLLALPALLVIVASGRKLRRAARSSAAWCVFGLTTLLVPVLGIGAFEAFYNHLVKNALYFLGAPMPLMLQLFPPPTYELPNDAWFELSGVAQLIPGGAAAWSLFRLAKQRRQRAATRAPTFVRPRHLATISARVASTSESGAATVLLPDPERVVHLQLRRFAGCPVCHLHLRSFVRRAAELERAHIREVVVFHSPAEELRRHAAELPFAVVPDPHKVLYAEFGVETSPGALLNPRAWPAIALGVARSLRAAIQRKEPLPPIRPHQGSLGLPADFLIAPDGRVLAAKYGAHADDQWSVDDVISISRAI